MPKFRPKMEPIIAVQFNGEEGNVAYIRATFGDQGIYWATYASPSHLIVDTLNGSKRPARIGDWVVPDIQNGTFKVFSNQDFTNFFEHIKPDFPYQEGDFTVLGPDIFTNGQTISYKGENYYRSCGWVVDLVDEGQKTHCILPSDHHGRVHEDYKGMTILIE